MDMKRSELIVFQRIYEGSENSARGSNILITELLPVPMRTAIKTGSFSAARWLFFSVMENQLDNNFLLGVNVETDLCPSLAGITSSAGRNRPWSFIIHIPDSRWNFGFSILNLGSQLEKLLRCKEDLPLDMRLGFSKDFEKLPLRFFLVVQQHDR